MLSLPAIFALALAGLIGFHVIQGTLPWDGVVESNVLARTLVMGRSSVVLLVLSVVPFGLAGLAFGRDDTARQERPDALGMSLMLGIGGATLAACGLLIALYAGFISGVDRNLTTWVFVAVALGVHGAGVMIRKPPVAWLAVFVTAIASLHACVFNTITREWIASQGWSGKELVLAVLVHGTALQVAAWMGRRGDERVSNREPLESAMSVLACGTLVPLILVLPAIVTITQGRYAFHAELLLWSAVLTGSCAAAVTLPAIFAAAQALVSLSVAYFAVAWCRAQPWWSGVPHDARLWLVILGSVAASCAAWIGFRKAFARAPVVLGLFPAEMAPLDRWLLGGIALVVLLIVPTLPAVDVMAELSAFTTTPPGPSALADTVRALGVFGVLLAMLSATWIRREGTPVDFIVTLPAVLVAGGWGAFASQTWVQGAARLTPAAAWPSWLTVGLVAAVVGLALWERRSSAMLLVSVLLPLAIPYLLAETFGGPGTAASIIRWGVIGYAALLAMVSRPIARAAASPQFAMHAERLGLLAAALPVFVQALLVASWVNTPVKLWHVAWLNLTVPFALVVALAWYVSARQRNAVVAMTASILGNIGATLAFILYVELGAAGIWSSAEWLLLLNWNGIALAGSAMLWWLLRRQIHEGWSAGGVLGLYGTDPSKPEPSAVLMLVQLVATQLLLGLLVLWATAVIVLRPGVLPTALSGLATPVAQVYLLMTGMTVGLHVWERRSWMGLLHLVGALVTASVVFIAAAMVAQNSPTHWLALHVLISGWTNWALVGAAAACGLTWLALDRQREAEAQRWHAWDTYQRTGRTPGGLEELEDAVRNLPPRDAPAGFPELLARSWTPVSEAARWWATGVGALAIVGAGRSLLTDPGRPLWTVLPFLALGMGAAALALRGRSQTYAYTSTRLIWLGVSAWFLRPWLDVGLAVDREAWTNLIGAPLIALALCGFFWLALEIYWQRRFFMRFAARPKYPPVPHTAGPVGLAILGALAVIAVQSRMETGQPWPYFDVGSQTVWTAFTFFVALLVFSLWDRWAVHVLPCLFAASLVAGGMHLESLDLIRREFAWGVMLVPLGDGPPVVGRVVVARVARRFRATADNSRSATRPAASRTMDAGGDGAGTRHRGFPRAVVVAGVPRSGTSLGRHGRGRGLCAVGGRVGRQPAPGGLPRLCPVPWCNDVCHRRLRDRSFSRPPVDLAGGDDPAAGIAVGADRGPQLRPGADAAERQPVAQHRAADRRTLRNRGDRHAADCSGRRRSDVRSGPWRPRYAAATRGGGDCRHGTRRGARFDGDPARSRSPATERPGADGVRLCGRGDACAAGVAPVPDDAGPVPDVPAAVVAVRRDGAGVCRCGRG